MSHENAFDEQRNPRSLHSITESIEHSEIYETDISSPKYERKGKKQNVTVVIRIRPLNQKEISESQNEIWIERYGNTVIEMCYPSYTEGKQLRYDHVFGPNCTTRQIYDSATSPIIRAFIDGYNGYV